MLDKLRQQLVQYGPALLRIPAQFTPFSVQQKILFETLGRVFKEAAEEGDVDVLDNRWLKVSIVDLGLSWCISRENDQWLVAESCPQVDVHFQGQSSDLILVAAQKVDPDTLFFQRRLVIEGDTELGLEIKSLMDSVDLSTLPAPVQFMLKQSADFIEKGQASAEVQHAH